MNGRTKEEVKASLIKHYSTWGRTPDRIQHLFDLDSEFPEVDIFGPRCISAEVGPGWKKILRPVMQILKDNGCTAGQIKQKFGGLRFYWNYPEHIEAAIDEWRNALPVFSTRPANQSIDEFYAEHPCPFKEETEALRQLVGPIVSEAERLSFRTCENCGADVGHVGGHGYKTECDDCKSVERTELNLKRK